LAHPNKTLAHEGNLRGIVGEEIESLAGKFSVTVERYAGAQSMAEGAPRLDDAQCCVVRHTSLSAAE